ncbi:uncharacterized protein RSE6_01083 [Rhynchosporium secalis]|uniref:BTB domain-containing protein n=1 Tax=Rhynchosporium secalis TaxID=38038 RepID=A0A1E1LWY0_RHYSE|nr:uncharacterized protein RSE6_01083 [Rhynchosporium secalis]
MAIETIVFDPDGDVVFRLRYPTDNNTATPSNTPSNASAHPRPHPLNHRRKHMTLSSPVSKAMLRGNFEEGQALRSIGSVQVQLPHDEPNPFKILLHIEHGMYSEVPNQVDSANLRGVSILVDKCRMKVAVSLYVERIWTPELSSSLSTSYLAECYLWLDVSWVFGTSAEFKKITMRLVEEIPGDFLTHIGNGFMIPDSVLTCNGMVLGALLLCSASAGIYPLPAAPYADLTIKTLAKTFRSLGIVSLCDIARRKDVYNVPYLNRSQGQKKYLEEQVTTCMAKAQDFDLDSFVRRY